MATTSLHATATIHQFPLKVRAAGEHRGQGGGSVAELPGAFLPCMEFGSGWYHDAAIEEERRLRQRDGH